MPIFHKHSILPFLCILLLATSQLYAQSESKLKGVIVKSDLEPVTGVLKIFKVSPNAPVLNFPLNLSTDVSLSPLLDVTVSDNDLDNLTVTYYGRVLPGAVVQPDFTLVGLPDTQNYTGVLSGGTNEIFKAQTQWIANHRVANNIAYVSHVGDLVQSGDNGGNPIEWQRADSAMKFLEDPLTTLLPDGIPYGIAVGNHEQSPKSDPHGTTTFYNQYFGSSRYFDRSYYCGHYGSDNDNSYQFFSTGGLSFIVLYLEYDPAPEPSVLNWADSLLKVYNNRRGIVVSHYLLDGNSFSTQGRVIYDSLKDNPNLFLMLCGHLAEGRRQDTFNGKTVYTLMSDFQGRSHGGDGWLRLMEFSPISDSIRVKTYSPTLGQYENDSDSKFSLYYNMKDTNFQVLGIKTNISSGSSCNLMWPVLSPMTDYEWYVTVSDGNTTTTSPRWRFTTLDLPLPIQIANLSAESNPDSRGVVLSWSTVSEINNYGFYIERRRDGELNFGEVANSFIQGSGTTLEPQNYSFTDNTINLPGTYTYRLRQIDNDGLAHYSREVVINTSLLSVKESVPTEFKVYQNYPNPFNPSTNISFTVENAGYTTLKVFNVLGQEVVTLFDGNAESGKMYSVNFNASTSGGLTSGVYFYRLEARSVIDQNKIFTQVRKLLLLR